jgi:hypothetical protein
MYASTISNKSFHGAFQFVISNSRHRMKGKWIGFDRRGIDIGCGEWRWEQMLTTSKPSEDDLQSVKQKSMCINLFDDTIFEM